MAATVSYILEWWQTNMTDANENPNIVEFSLKDYADLEVKSFNSALEGVGIKPSASIVFGSAVNPTPESSSIKLNPSRWDVDLLEIVDTIAPLREKPHQFVTTDTGSRYGCIVPPTNTTAELQEADAMSINSPNRGLHIQIVEQSELLNGEIDPMLKKALATGVLIDGQITSDVRARLGKLGIQMPRKPDEVMWSSLRYSKSRGRLF